MTRKAFVLHIDGYMDHSVQPRLADGDSVPQDAAAAVACWRCSAGIDDDGAACNVGQVVADDQKHASVEVTLAARRGTLIAARCLPSLEVGSPAETVRRLETRAADAPAAVA